MELSWTTFVLEIINFLVLVWILKRFLYKPVLEVIARRRAGIEKRLGDAEALHADAEKLQKQYEGRLVDWDQERQQARESLARELDAERARKMAELQTALEQASGPDTEARLVELLITELPQLPAERIATLRNHYGKTPENIVVVSAFPLSDDQRHRLQQALATVTTPDISIRFEQNNELLAGVQITIGTWILDANLRDELKGFMELAHNE